MQISMLALLGSRTGEARASVGTAPSSRHIRGMTWRRSLCGSGYRSGPVNRSAGQDAATRSRLAGYGSVPVAAKPADDILTDGVDDVLSGDVDLAYIGHAAISMGYDAETSNTALLHLVEFLEARMPAT